MKLYAPLYYSEFTCTADKCTHSCCIGWEVDVDPAALDKYKKLDDPYKDEIIYSISFEGEPHFTLCEDERCPHLDSRGLCKIILCAGEGYLCDICREHPRFYNNAPTRSEVGLGMACEESARIILSSDAYDCFVQIGENELDEEYGFDPLPLRDELFSILKAECSHEEKLKKIYSRFGVSPAMLPDDEWHRVLSECEYLYEEHSEAFPVYSSDLQTPAAASKSLERALAYFAMRHCTEAVSHDDFLSRLGFALFCERLLASLIKNIPDTATVCHAVAISEELEYCEENTQKLMSFFDIEL